MKLKVFFVYFFVSCTAIPAWPQSSTAPGIRVIARNKIDSVILRWGPTTPVAWEVANQSGYLIMRYTVAKDGALNSNKPEGVLLTPSPIAPLPLAQWEPVVKKDKYAAIAAQALYGKTFKVSNPGSNTMQFIDQVQERESRWSFALFSADNSVTAANALGLRFVDKTIKKNEKYLYRIYLAKPSANYPLDSGAVFVDPNEKLELPPPEDVKAEFGDLSVALNWDTFYFQSIYSAYQVERSDDEGKTFKTTSELVFVNTRPVNGRESKRTHYLDSIPQNYKVFYYRVKGITPFGETGPPSKVVQGTGLGSASGVAPVISSTEVNQDGSAVIHWKYPKEMLARVKGFTVGRASNAKGPFTDITPKLLSPETGSCKDKTPGSINYYVVKAIGQDGQTATSFPYMIQLEDNSPPASPKGLSAKIDMQGVVTLRWAANQESDLIGYRVFIANDPKEEFVQITREAVGATEWKDTVNLKTLTRHVYYQVVAVDDHFNSSAFSEMLQVERPDIVPPSASQFSKAESVGNRIQLEWIPSVSEDAAAYDLYRSVRGGTTNVLLKTFSKDSTRFMDVNVEPGKQYQYRLIVRDKAGLNSAPVSISVNCIDYGVRAPVTDIQFNVDREARQIVLQWSYKKEGLRGFQIYRMAGSNAIRFYKFTTATQTQFVDKDLRANSKYGYAIKAIFENGAESELSQIKLVEY